ADELREVLPAPDDGGRGVGVAPGALREGEGVVRVDGEVVRPAQLEAELRPLRGGEVRVPVGTVDGEATVEAPVADLVLLRPVEAGEGQRGALTEALAEAELVLR